MYAVWRPLQTGADACLLQEFLGANFVCMHMHFFRDPDEKEQHQAVAESRTELYPFALLTFASDAAFASSLEKVRRQFPDPSLHNTPLEEWLFFSF